MNPDEAKRQRRRYQKKYGHSAKLILSSKRLGLEWHAILPTQIAGVVYVLVADILSEAGLSGVKLQERHTNPHPYWSTITEATDDKKPP